MKGPSVSRGGRTTTANDYYRLRARTRSSRLVSTLKTPASFGIPSCPRKEDVTDLRRDILGPLIKQHIPVVPDGSRANLLAAFDKRCNYYSDSRVPRSYLAANSELLHTIAPTAWDPLVYDRQLFEEWNSQFDSAKQARHVRAYGKISDATLRDFTDKEIFVKVEALLKRHDASWAPRIIYQSSDLHNVLLGPVMWKCCKRMFMSLDQDKESDVVRMASYAKQTPAIVSHINSFGSDDSIYVECDFSSNDMTQVKDVHALEVNWLAHFGAPAWLTALMLVANSFRVSSRKHRVKASIKNQLPTGAQSTTFRNSMWNLTLNYVFCKRVGAHGAVLVLGDDMLMRLDPPFSMSRRRDYRRTYEDVCRRGHMRPEVKTFSFLEECSFLSKHFVPTSSGSYVMLPFLGKAAARFNVRASSNESVSDDSYLAGKALSYAYEFRFCPGLRDKFLRRFKQLHDGQEPSLDALGWNAKGAFLRLGVSGICSAILSPGPVGQRDDFNRFWHTRYGLTYSDVMELTERLLFGEGHVDADGLVALVRDFT